MQQDGSVADNIGGVCWRRALQHTKSLVWCHIHDCSLLISSSPCTRGSLRSTWGGASAVGKKCHFTPLDERYASKMGPCTLGPALVGFFIGTSGYGVARRHSGPWLGREKIRSTSSHNVHKPHLQSPSFPRLADPRETLTFKQL
eukprot:s122_g8.t1